MTTSPRLPDDEAPLDAKTIEILFSALGADTVLVGGQALAFWMQRYGIDAHHATISNDGDIIGKVARANEIALALGASVVVPDQTERTSLVAQIRLPARGGKVGNVDVLHLLYTVGAPRKSVEFTNRVKAHSVEVRWREGQAIRVMHPLDVLESRVQNAAGLLEEKGPHVLTQTEWAIQVARAAILRVAHAPEPGSERPGQMIQQVFRLAHSQPGRSLLKDHGIEILSAVDTRALRAATQNELQEQLDRVDAALQKRKPPLAST